MSVVSSKYKQVDFKKGSMQERPRVEKCPIAIQFLATYVTVMGVSNHI